MHTSETKYGAADAAVSPEQDLASKTAGRVRSLEARVSQVASDAAASASNYVRSNPWTVMAVAGAVGIAIGALVSRRS